MICFYSNALKISKKVIVSGQELMQASLREQSYHMVVTINAQDKRHQLGNQFDIKMIRKQCAHFM